MELNKPPREDFHLAVMVAETIYPYPPEGEPDKDARSRDNARMRALKHFAQLCGKQVKEGYVRYAYAEVYLAWRVLYSKYEAEKDIDGLWDHPPTLMAVVSGTPPFIERWREEVVKNIPPIYLAYAHDKYVVQHAEALRALGWHYAALDGVNRLPREVVAELGLLETEGETWQGTPTEPK